MKKQIPLVLAFTLVTAVTAAGAAWYLKPQHMGAAKAAEEVAEPPNPKYISLEKVIVMLRGEAGGPMSHYLSVDLVFKSSAEQEKAAKQQLPMLRSVAVKALSNFSFEKAGMMTIDELSTEINEAYLQSYAKNPKSKPFSEVMIGKLIIE